MPLKTFVFAILVAVTSFAVAAEESAQLAEILTKIQSKDLDQQLTAKLGPPRVFLSIQHFYAILKRCEDVAPEMDDVARRHNAFERLLSGAKTLNGTWRTFIDSEGKVRETQFSSARDMFSSPEFAMDVRRYHEWVALVPMSVQKTDCAEFEALVNQALSDAASR